MLATVQQKKDDESFEFLEKLSFLIFESARFKVAWGGRGAGKTEGMAIALILLSRTKKLRILCLRELQNSIDESIKATLEANITSMGLDNEFEIQNARIICRRTGSEFIFYGLKYNINKIKSLGRIDIAWIEEANNVSKSSWDKLEPTIRGRSQDDPNGQGGPFGNGPEIWVSFNPELDTDETYTRFILKREQFYPDWVVVDKEGNVLFDQNGKFIQECSDSLNAVKKIRYAIVVKINWQDNKFFPPDLRMQMGVMQRADETKYLEVWEGHTKQVLDGAIYADELRSILKVGRRGKVPYDPTRPVFTFWDLGHNDKTAIWFIQRVGLEYNVINYYENRLKKLPHYLEYMQSLHYVYGTVYQPHDADNETLAANSIAQQTRDAGFKVITVKRPAKKVNGINAVRTVLPLCNFDEENTTDGWQCLSRYAYKVDEQTQQFSKEPDHDTPWSHGADGFQTFALSLISEQEAKKPKPKADRSKLLIARPNSWMLNS